MDLNFDAVILAYGEFPSHELPLSVLRGAKFLCCCDGAAERCVAEGLTPNAIVGDGDSLPPNLKAQYADILHIVSEQESNDLTKATRFCVAQGFSRIAYIGATGRREDHTLGNISLMAQYLEELRLRPVMLTDYGYFVPANGACEFDTFARQQVSLFNISCTRLTSRGLRWNTYAYNIWWQGTLNEATGDTITLDGNGSYLVYRTYEPKGTKPDTQSKAT